MDEFERELLRSIRKRDLLTANDRVVAAVSGGPDSVALLLGLAAAAGELGIRLSAFHFNHRLRADSDLDEAFVRELCHRLGLSLTVESEDTRAFAARQGRNLEETARVLRYRALARAAGESPAATGHTADDQAETLLMKLMRGAGPTGLASIRERWDPSEAAGLAPLRLVRPLLGFRRGRILDYLGRRGQDFRVDQSNLDLRYQRNWVRHKLIPLLAERVNPALIDTLSKTGGLLAEASDYLRDQARSSLRACRTSDNPARLRVARMASLPPILQKEVIREACFQLTRVRLDYAHVDQVLELLRSPQAGETALPGGWRVAREFETLLIAPSQSTPPFSRPFTPPGTIDIAEVGKQLVAEEVDPQRAVDDGLFVPTGQPVQVRNRRPGDRYRVSPSSPEKKLKRMLADRRVPRTARDDLLVLQVGERIAWVEGFPAHPDFSAAPRHGRGKRYRLTVVPLSLAGGNRGDGPVDSQD